MRRVWRRAAAVGLLLVMMAAGALAQETMRVYVAAGALEEETAQQLVEMIARAYPQNQWEMLHQSRTGESLRELVLRDGAPALAICTPGEARPWAQEGMLLPLQRLIGEQGRMQPQVLDACVLEETLFMAPLAARHRQMAVNVQRFEVRHLGHMLDHLAHPVWYPTEFYQILEEFLLAEETAMEVWQEPDGAALEAMVQALYDGALLSEDGRRCTVSTPELCAGLRWMGEAVVSGLIGRAESREAALERFAAGETAIFPDWTAQEDALLGRELAARGMELEIVPYPASVGLPVRAFEVTGVSVFGQGDAATNAQALRAAVFLHENTQAQALLGNRLIWRDNAVWLPSLDAYARGATLRSLFGEAVRRVLAGEIDASRALEDVQAAMDALQ